jgi:hypothetical protein
VAKIIVVERCIECGLCDIDTDLNSSCLLTKQGVPLNGIPESCPLPDKPENIKFPQNYSGKWRTPVLVAQPAPATITADRTKEIMAHFDQKKEG